MKLTLHIKCNKLQHIERCHKLFTTRERDTTWKPYEDTKKRCHKSGTKTNCKMFERTHKCKTLNIHMLKFFSLCVLMQSSNFVYRTILWVYLKLSNHTTETIDIPRRCSTKWYLRFKLNKYQNVIYRVCDITYY